MFRLHSPTFSWRHVSLLSYNGCMLPADQEQESGPGSARHFATTRWSLVLAAGASQSRESAAALAALCETYWYPLYAYVRRRGHQVDDAQDLTQAFFARLLEKNDLATADSERGKFRSFLLTSLKHFLANEWDRGRAKSAAADGLRCRSTLEPPKIVTAGSQATDSLPRRSSSGAGPWSCSKTCWLVCTKSLSKPENPDLRSPQGLSDRRAAGCLLWPIG